MLMGLELWTTVISQHTHMVQRLDDEQFMNELSAFKQLNSLFVDIPVREVNMQLLTKQLLECVPSLTELNGVPILSNNQLTIRTMNSNRSKLVIRTANDVLEGSVGLNLDADNL